MKYLNFVCLKSLYFASICKRQFTLHIELCFIFFFFLLVILSSSPLSLHHPAPHWKAGCQSHLYSPIHKMCFSVASLVFFSCSTGFKQCDYNFLQHCFLFALCAGVPWNSWNIFHSFFGICIIFQDYYFFFFIRPLRVVLQVSVALYIFLSFSLCFILDCLLLTNSVQIQQYFLCNI